MGDLNGIIMEWLCSTTTNRLGVAAFDLATVSGWDQSVVGPTDASGGTLDLLTNDVPDLVRVVVVAPIGKSDHTLSGRIGNVVASHAKVARSIPG